LLKSELFGHVKGAFTGAVEDKIGCFEKADGGTILLDEIGEVSEQMQVSLLRILQDKTFQRVGDSETREADVRVVCATNRDLEHMVEEGAFRLDLYYRLKGVVLRLPPLRERRQDIPLLTRHFVDKYSQPEESVSVDQEVIKHLSSYNWPGNIRELENLIQSLLLFVENGKVDKDALESVEEFFEKGNFAEDVPDIDYSAYPPSYEGKGDEPTASHESKDVSDRREDGLVDRVISTDVSLGEMKERLQNASIQRALEQTNGNISEAARLLDMNRSRLSQIVNGNEDLLELKEELVS
jgi:transcriptional regulator with GAF, ATPase, and Fis domain